MAAAWGWGRSWRSKVSSTARGGNTGEDDGRSLRVRVNTAAGTGTTPTSSATYTSGSNSNTTISGPVPEGSFDLFYQRATAPVVEEIGDELSEEERVKKLENINALVVRFPCDKSAPERWLSELEVNWVLHLSNVSESGRSFVSGQLLYLSRSWTLALLEITKSVSIYFGPWCITKLNGRPPASQFIQFVEETLSKMLRFVYAIVAVTRPSAGTTDWCGSVEPADEKLQALMLVRDALSTASEQILSVPSCLDLLPAELLMAKLDEAIWNIMEGTKEDFMSSSWGAPRSCDIHPITRSVISYIKVLWVNYRSANRILHDAFLRGESVPDNENASHLTNLTKEMIHSLEQKLARNMQSIPWNKSLKLLFLINNFYFIHQQKQLWPLAFPMPELAGKIDDYINSYIQESWTPVLKCLHNPTPRCFRRNRNSPLLQFETKFLSTYTTQKVWKVPNPGMKRKMREAIVEEVIPYFIEFLKDNNNSPPKITPEEMKSMLHELFEG